MQEITLYVPDNFSSDMINFIKLSAVHQIEAEIKKSISVSQEELAAANAEITALKAAMNITEPNQEV